MTRAPLILGPWLLIGALLLAPLGAEVMAAGQAAPVASPSASAVAASSSAPVAPSEGALPTPSPSPPSSAAQASPAAPGDVRISDAQVGGGPALHTGAPGAIQPPGATASPVGAGASTGDPTVTALNNIETDLEERRRDLATLERRLAQTPEGPQRAALTAEWNRLDQSIPPLQTAFESLLTGGLISASGQTPSAASGLDWRQDLEDVVEPILAQLKGLLANMRQEETLRKRIDFHQSRLATALAALRAIHQSPAAGLSPAARDRVRTLAGQWGEIAASQRDLLDAARLELADWTRNQQAADLTPPQRARAFLDGRSGTVVLVIGAGALSFLGLGGLRRLAGRRGVPGRRSQFRRILGLTLGMLTVVIPIGLMLFIAQQRDDQVVLASLALILVGIAWVLKNTIPDTLEEIKLVLDVGAVREQERIMFRGAPWEVVSLNIFGWLRNPLMSPSLIRVPLKTLLGYQSRPFHPSDPWFPCAREEWVVLSDNVFGQVELITPEEVTLKVPGGSIQTYPLGDFLKKAPKNLSRGFSVNQVIQIDYQHLEVCTTEVPTLLEEAVREGLGTTPLGEHVKLVGAGFSAAGDSALEILTYAVFAGEGASNYRSAQREVSRLALEACIRHGWRIPYPQLMVHHAPGD